MLQPAYGYHTTTAKPQRNTNTHRLTVYSTAFYFYPIHMILPRSFFLPFISQTISERTTQTQHQLPQTAYRIITNSFCHGSYKNLSIPPNSLIREDSGLLGCEPVWLDQRLPTFRKYRNAQIWSVKSSRLDHFLLLSGWHAHARAHTHTHTHTRTHIQSRMPKRNGTLKTPSGITYICNMCVQPFTYSPQYPPNSLPTLPQTYVFIRAEVWEFHTSVGKCSGRKRWESEVHVHISSPECRTKLQIASLLLSSNYSNCVL